MGRQRKKPSKCFRIAANTHTRSLTLAPATWFPEGELCRHFAFTRHARRLSKGNTRTHTHFPPASLHVTYTQRDKAEPANKRTREQPELELKLNVNKRKYDDFRCGKCRQAAPGCLQLLLLLLPLLPPLNATFALKITEKWKRRKCMHALSNSTQAGKTHNYDLEKLPWDRIGGEGVGKKETCTWKSLSCGSL